jgi:hypothetical protein
MSLRRTTAAGLAALALFSVAACGTSHKAGSDHSSSTSSASGNASTGTGGALAQKLEKVFTDGKSAHVTMDMGSTGKGVGDIEFASSNPALDLTISGGQAGNAEVRLVDGVMYLKSSMAGEKWLKMDSSVAGSTGFDPSKLFDQLKDVKGGTDLGNGHWMVDEGNGISADIYFNSDGTLQKSVVTGAGTNPITVTYNDWGKKVEVQAPPKDQVMDMPNLSNPSIPSMTPQ